MGYNKFFELDRDIDHLYEQKKYNEAMDLYEIGITTLPEQEVRDNFFALIWTKAVLCTVCNKYDECLDVIKQSVDMGFAFPLQFERFKPLKQRAG
jgi:hypothetical protein